MESTACEPMDVDTSGESSSPAPQEEHYLYIAMELCEGGTLQKWIEGKRMDSTNYTAEFYKECSTTIFKQICSGVRYIHKAGLIHRDLKPDNIYFTEKNHVKIGDFGLATNTGKGIAGSQNRGHTGGVGTWSYMAPEVKVSTDYTSKADIYSLGMIWLDLLVPFGTEESGP